MDENKDYNYDRDYFIKLLGLDKEYINDEEMEILKTINEIYHPDTIKKEFEHHDKIHKTYPQTKEESEKFQNLESFIEKLN